ncbi:hypothetical protein G7046_g2657 [Stylonectria norvegica]|nr:hypothetical protein G7046_g2657 [Stylonectria norvegica]
MPRLPPAEKLPLAVRKNIRDGWENKKEEYEKAISETLGQPWTIKINPNAIFPYGDDGSWAKTSTGDLIAGYIQGAARSLKSFVEANGDEGKDEINTIASAHTITMDFDEAKKVYYCGAQVSPEGELVILFAEGNLGSNIDQAFDRDNITKALNEAPAGDNAKPLSYVTRKEIRNEYTPNIAAIQEKVNKILGKEITLDPNFEDVYAKLKASPKSTNDWEEHIGPYVRFYFKGLADHLESKGFGDDEMLQEGLVEALESSTVHFRITNELKSYYNEAVFEDGVLYLQTSPENFGSNIDQVADKLIDLL